MKSKREIRKSAELPIRTEGGWMETVVLAANKSAVQAALDRLTPEDLPALDMAHVEARGDWRRKMIVDARRRIERDKAEIEKRKPGGGSREPGLAEKPPVRTILGFRPMPATVALAAITDDPDHRTAADIVADAKLSESMEHEGLLQPIILFGAVGAGGADARYICADGRRRLAIARKLGWKEIAAVVFPAADETTRRRISALANLERRDLNPLEECLAVSRLLESLAPKHQGAEWTDVPPHLVDQAAAMLGRSPAWVRDRAYLSRLCPKVRDMVAERRLPLAQAREIAKLAGAEDQQRVAGSTVNDWSGAGSPDMRGKIEVESVERVRRWVAERLSTLRGVPWEPGIAFAGRPACSGCPDNSAHAVLFDVDDKDAAPEARCLNTPCYKIKMRQAERALADAAKKLKGKKTVAPTAAGVRGSAPDYLKGATVARHLARARGIEPPLKGPAGAKREKEVPWDERPENRLRSAHRKWSDAIAAAVAKKIKESNERVACAVLAFGSDTYSRHIGCLDTPSKAQRARIEPVLKRIVRANPDDLAALAADLPADAVWGVNTAVLRWVVRRLAGLLDVNLPREPVLADFQPKPEKKAAEGEGKNKKAGMGSRQAGTGN